MHRMVSFGLRLKRLVCEAKSSQTVTSLSTANIDNKQELAMVISTFVRNEYPISNKEYPIMKAGEFNRQDLVFDVATRIIKTAGRKEKC